GGGEHARTQVVRRRAATTLTGSRRSPRFGISPRVRVGVISTSRQLSSRLISTQKQRSAIASSSSIDLLQHWRRQEGRCAVGSSIATRVPLSGKPDVDLIEWQSPPEPTLAHRKISGLPQITDSPRHGTLPLPGVSRAVQYFRAIGFADAGSGVAGEIAKV